MLFLLGGGQSQDGAQTTISPPVVKSTSPPVAKSTSPPISIVTTEGGRNILKAGGLNPGEDGPIQCVTTCKSNGGCKVAIVNGPPGKRQGSCFPPKFHGECYGIPDLCAIGTSIEQQCGSPCQEGTRNV